MKALICSTRMPEFDRECGSKRIFDLLQFLKAAGWSVTYVARDADRNDRYARLLRQEATPAYIGLDTLTEDFLTRNRFDLALLAFWPVAEACLPPLRRWSPDTRVLVDSIDLHYLRNARGAFKTSDGRAARGLDARIGDEFVREVNTYAAADGVLAVSQKEADLIANLTGQPDAVRAVPLCEDLARSPVPFSERNGVLFVGNFWHQPNVEAARHLVEEILPRVNPSLLADHPLRIVGNASADCAARFAGHRHVHVVGWVPSLVPYLQRARLTTVPLLYGAGTKGKLLQALITGTPTVSTTVGTEGLDVEYGRDLLVADDAGDFAAAIESLLTDEELWWRLSDRGHAHLTRTHGRDAVNATFLNAVDHFLARSTPPVLCLADARAVAPPAYDTVRGETRAAIERAVPAGATVAVISKGDETLLQLDGRRGEHFPRLADGRYAGAYPADGLAAVAALRGVQASGVAYLAIPSTYGWWLEHYREFRDHLAQHAEVTLRTDHCTIYRLEASSPSVGSSLPARIADRVPAQAGRRRAKERPPRVRPRIEVPLEGLGGDKPRVLALGIYLPGQLNNAVDEVAVLRATTMCHLEQRWVALGGHPPPGLADVTVTSLFERMPKFEIVNLLVGTADLTQYDYIVVLDDDIVLPHGFLDGLIGLQRRLGFALAQPARTSDSYYDHPIVEQQRGVVARQTMFVEIGPVTSIHRSIFDLLLPFDLTSSMGWGYENVWSYRLRERGLKMGIIDAVPVSHSLRKPVANYSWHEADRQRHEYLARHRHLDLDECFRVIDIVNHVEGAPV